MNKFFDFLMLFSGILCSGFGGEFFLRGTVGIARGLRISTAIIGATVAAFATSSPELTVAVNAALSGKPQLSLGDILGSNIVNVSLILGIALCFSPIMASRSSMRRDFPIVLFLSILFSLLLFDNEISRLEGILLLITFCFWFSANIVEAHRQRKIADNTSSITRLWITITYSFAGLGLLLVGGYLIVSGARGLAISLGLDEFIIGATIVAIGTSVPELATVLVAKYRGHDEIGLGTILGSNIFNSLLIVGLVAIIFPIQVAWEEVMVALIVGLASVVCLYPNSRGVIGRWRSIPLLWLYLIYLALILGK